MANSSKNKVSVQLPDKTILDFISVCLKKGKRVRVVGLGIFEMRKIKARTIINFQTNAPLKIAATSRVAFIPSKTFKDSL